MVNKIILLIVLLLAGSAFGQAEVLRLRDLKGMIPDTYDALSHQKEATLGPLMIQQRAVIRASVRKCAGGIRE